MQCLDQIQYLKTDINVSQKRVIKLKSAPVFLCVLNDHVLQVSKCKMQQRARNVSEQMLSVKKKQNKNANSEVLNNSFIREEKMMQWKNVICARIPTLLNTAGLAFFFFSFSPPLPTWAGPMVMRLSLRIL